MYESQPIKLDLCSNVRVEEADTALLFPVRLYFCNDAVAPETRDHSKYTPAEHCFLLILSQDLRNCVPWKRT